MTIFNYGAQDKQFKILTKIFKLLRREYEDWRVIAEIFNFFFVINFNRAALKRAEIDKKVEERVAADRRKIMEEKKQLLIKKREKEKLLNLLQAKNELGHLVGF